MDLLSTLLEAFAPTRCAGCDMPGVLLCEKCAAKLSLIEPEHACPVCGAPYGWLTCTECWGREPAYAAARTLALLEPPLSRCLVMYKDAGEKRLADVLGDLLVRVAADWLGWAEAITPVPATAAALRRRGYDHAQLMAERLGRVSGVEVRRLLCPSGARDQRRLGREERCVNTAGAFTAAPDTRPPRFVLLVDDVMTTGSTADAAAGVLLTAGATEVRVCALARAW